MLRDEPQILHSRQNARVQEARRIAHDQKLARREGLLVADGVTLVRDALRAGLKARWIFLNPADPEAASLRGEAAHRGLSVTLAAQTVCDALSSLTAPQAAIGIFERPRADVLHLLAAPRKTGHPLVAVLHGLQDPTNAGALVRTALATGLTGAIATEGTVDPFHTRAVRASMGACFRLPLVVDQPAEPLWEHLRRGGYRTLALDPRGETALAEIRIDRPTAILLGREGGGLDEAARAACETSVRIPMRNAVDSFGVAAAGAIVFYILSVREDT